MLYFSKNIWLVAFFSFFLSISTQMLYSHLALFLKFGCDISELRIATIDGLVEFLSYIIRVFSGAVSDYLYNRKLLLFIGCSIAITVKPIFAITNSFFTVFLTEIAERLGSGIQASPRDALIADLSDNKKLGASFGFCKAMKTTGGIVGSLIAVIIVYFSCNNYKLLFTLSSIPAIFAIFCVQKIKILKILDPKIKKFYNPFRKNYLKSLDFTFWRLIFIAFLCELGHFGESLLTLRASHLISPNLAGLTSIFGALGQILFAYFLGIASDKIEKFKILKINLTLILISYILMGSIPSLSAFLLGIFLMYGQYAVIQLVFLSLINAHVSKNLRGTAIGVFYCVIGLSYMISTRTCGFLCQNFSYNVAFFYTFFISAITLSIIFASTSPNKAKTIPFLFSHLLSDLNRNTDID